MTDIRLGVLYVWQRYADGLQYIEHAIYERKVAEFTVWLPFDQGERWQDLKAQASFGAAIYHLDRGEADIAGATSENVLTFARAELESALGVCKGIEGCTVAVLCDNADLEGKAASWEHWLPNSPAGQRL